MLEQKFVDPLLTAESIAEHIAPALTAGEERLAFLHISIDLIERDNSRNMTKAAYESLVLAVLHGSTHETTVSREAIYEKLACVVRDISSDRLKGRIDSALDRLSVRHGKLKHIRGSDSFHISHDQTGKIKQGTETFLDEEASFEQDILAAIYLVDSDIVDDDDCRDDCVQAIKEIIEKLLLDYGEQFSTAISTGRIPETNEGTLEHLLTEMAFKTHLTNTAAVDVIKDVSVIE